MYCGNMAFDQAQRVRVLTLGLVLAGKTYVEADADYMPIQAARLRETVRSTSRAEHDHTHCNNRKDRLVTAMSKTMLELMLVLVMFLLESI